MSGHALDLLGLRDPVARLLREAARDIVLPRYGRLGPGERHEKSPGNLVTIADREAEAFLIPRLEALLPGSRVVGEELVAERPEALEDLDRGLAWLVDPIDGTGNFAAGRAPFALMVALIEDGITLAAWILDPLADRLHWAALGAGAYVEAERIACRSSGKPLSAMAGSVLTGFLPPDLKPRVRGNLARFGDPRRGLFCAGAEYPAVAGGAQDFVFFWRTLPWDHAPGALILAEAGGHVAQIDGTPYRPGTPRPGLLAARSAEDWLAIRDALLAEET